MNNSYIPPEAAAPTRAAIYSPATSSSTRTAQVEARIEVCREYISSKKWVLQDAHVYTEPLAAASPDRSHVSTLNGALEANPCSFDKVVVPGLRSVTTTGALKLARHLSAFGVSLELAKEQLSSSDPNWAICLNMYALMDEQHCAYLGHRVRRGQYHRVLSGQTFGTACMGYRRVARTAPSYANSSAPSTESPGTSLVIVPEEAATIRGMFEEYANGGTTGSIASRLNAQGVNAPAAKSSTPWNSRRVRAILSNVLYRGEIVWGKTHRAKHPETGKLKTGSRPEHEWTRVCNPELRIVSDDLWREVEVRRHASSLGIHRKQTEPNFSSLVNSES